MTSRNPAAGQPAWNVDADGARYGPSTISGWAPGAHPLDWGPQPVDAWPVRDPGVAAGPGGITLSCWMDFRPPYSSHCRADGVVLAFVELVLEVQGRGDTEQSSLWLHKPHPEAGTNGVPSGETVPVDVLSESGQAMAVIPDDWMAWHELLEAGPVRARCRATPRFATIFGGGQVGQTYTGETAASPWYELNLKGMYDREYGHIPTCVREDGRVAHWTPPPPPAREYPPEMDGLFGDVVREIREGRSLERLAVARSVREFPDDFEADLWLEFIEINYRMPTAEETRGLAEALKVSPEHLEAKRKEAGW